jgi:hypothetical protein
VLDVRGILAIEDGEKVCHASFILTGENTKRLERDRKSWKAWALREASRSCVNPWNTLRANRKPGGVLSAIRESVLASGRR